MESMGEFTKKMSNAHYEALTGERLAANKSDHNAVFFTTMHDLGLALQAELKEIRELIKDVRSIAENGDKND